MARNDKTQNSNLKSCIGNLLELQNDFVAKHAEDNPERCVEMIQAVSFAINKIIQ